MTELWDTYLRAYVCLNSFTDSHRYTNCAGIDPLAVVTVDPARIEYLVEESVYPEQTRSSNRFPMPKFQHAGKVTNGSWGEPTHRFEDSTLFQGFKAHFQDGKPWEETSFFENAMEYINNGVDMWQCYTREEFKQRCSHIDDLYESINSEGYFSQAQLTQRSDPPMVNGKTNSLTKRIIYDEITVCIGRNGQLLFFDGRNRLAIAKLLDLSSIPVWIMVRHPDWQQTREAVASGKIPIQQLSEPLVNHPDLQGLW